MLDLNLFLIKHDRWTQRMADLDNELMNLQTVLDDNNELLRQHTERRDADQTAIAEYEDRITAARSGQLTCADELHRQENALTEVQTRRRTRAENRGRLQA